MLYDTWTRLVTKGSRREAKICDKRPLKKLPITRWPARRCADCRWWSELCTAGRVTQTDLPSLPAPCAYGSATMMIPLVAIVAVFVALPFFRRIDVTSAHEYLEKRFNRSVRLFGSASFTIFHIFRMGVVMSLTGLALAVATLLTPAQSVLVMGILSILYCTMGRIEAVIWTDDGGMVVCRSGNQIAV